MNINSSNTINPSLLMKTIPQELQRLNHWVGYELINRNGKITKVPKNVLTGGNACSNASETWASFATAIEFSLKRDYNGIGFMFRPPYVGIDIDHCIDNDSISPLAKEILLKINSYSEISPGGRGIHIICKGEIDKSFKVSSIGLEVYGNGRFFTCTGWRLDEYPAEVLKRTDELNEIYRCYVSPVDIVPEDLKELLEKVSRSKDADGFQKLYQGQWEGSYSSQSEADLAFCGKLAFWTGKNIKLMDRIFRSSKLLRPKWDERHSGEGQTYGQMTIEKAVVGCQDTYNRDRAENDKGRPNQGEIVTRILEGEAKDFLNDQHGIAHVVLPVNGHSEVWPIDSTKVKHWLARRFREKHGAPPSNEAISQALLQIGSKCDRARLVKLYNRVGQLDGSIYYDLVTPDWQGIKIDKLGSSVVPLPPLFRRDAHHCRQVNPIEGGDALEFLDFLNIQREDGCLFIVTVASYLIPDFPHPIIILRGEQGCGKSIITRKIKDVIDPSAAPLLSIPKEPEQLQMILDKNMVAAFDNVSSLSSEVCDLLCRAVTGEGTMKRRLYTNNEIFLRRYERCIVLNGIGPLTTRQDLLDRASIFHIPQLKETRPETLMEAEWVQARPRIFGGLITAVSKAMNLVDSVAGHEKFRMSDFARWGAALAEALGFSRDTFFTKYRKSINQKLDDSVEENFVVNKILQLLAETKSGVWAGSLTALLEKINLGNIHNKSLPTSPKGLSAELQRIAPLLRHIGVEAKSVESEQGTAKREPGTGRNLWEIRIVD